MQSFTKKMRILVVTADLSMCKLDFQVPKGQEMIRCFDPKIIPKSKHQISGGILLD